MNVIVAAIVNAVPLALAALGGVLSERAGVINFALEGMMLSGAFAAVWASHETGSGWAGLAAGMAAGMLIAALHAVVSLGLRVNQIVSSVAMNLMALGLTGALLWKVFEQQGTSPPVEGLPAVTIGGWSMNVLTPAPFVLAPIMWVVLRRSVWGLRLRATGEDANAARAAGVRVTRVKATAVVASGALAGAAGAYLSLGVLTSFTDSMTSGRGYAAVAAVIFGKWDPLGAVGACLLFGLFRAIADTLSVSAALPQEAYLALPYLLTLVALAGFVGKVEGTGGAGEAGAGIAAGRRRMVRVPARTSDRPSKESPLSVCFRRTSGAAYYRRPSVRAMPGVVESPPLACVCPA